MWRRLGFLIRRDERRPVAVAFAFLFGLVASHTALESARDGLFLARIPGDRLPFVYIGIAVLSFSATKVRRVVRVSSRRLEATGYTFFAGVGTLLLAALLPVLGDAGLYVLYVWTGIVTATILVLFWTILGDVFTARQAKRLYGVIGLGSMIGAVAGSGIASVLARLVEPSTILYISSAGLIGTAWFPRALPGRAEITARSEHEYELDPVLARFRANVKYATRGPYVWRLVGVAVAASVTLTLTDFVFKTTMAASVPRGQLTSAFAQTYLLLNVLALVVQLVVVGVFARRLSPAAMVAVLPILLTMGGAALAASGGLVVAIVMKGADGALRHGVYRTGLELFTVPLSEEARRKAKTAIDIAGQRGGQVLASTVIIVVTTIDHGTRVSAVVLVVAAVSWAMLAIKLHPYYVEQFRSTILSSTPRTVLAQLDVASLETLVATLDSDSTEEVLATLSILEREDKSHLVPALILYHPSEDVVVSALRLFARTRRRLPRHAFGHLLTSGSTRVRAEAYAAKVAMTTDAAELAEALRNERAPEVKAAIVTAMTGTGTVDPVEARAVLEELLTGASATTKIVVAEAIGWRRLTAFDDLPARLASDPAVAVRTAAIQALGALRTDRAADALVSLLADDVVQELARVALSQSGETASDALVRALLDPSRSPTLRWALPRALATVDPRRAARVLLENLEHERDGMVRYRTLVALGSIVERVPSVVLDRARLDKEIRENVSRAYRTMDRRLALQAGARAEPMRATPGHLLLVDMLHDKEKSAVGRIFRLLGLAFPEHDFGGIFRALENGERLHRASAVELTSHLLTSPLREAVVGLVDEIDDEARMAFGATYHDRIEPDYEAVLTRLLVSRSGMVRDLAAYHAAEIGDDRMLAVLVQVVAEGRGSSDVVRAVEVLSGARSLRDPAKLGAGSVEVIRVG